MESSGVFYSLVVDQGIQQCSKVHGIKMLSCSVLGSVESRYSAVFYGLSDQDAQHRCSGFRGIKVFSNVLGSMDQGVQQCSKVCRIKMLSTGVLGFVGSRYSAMF